MDHSAADQVWKGLVAALSIYPYLSIYLSVQLSVILLQSHRRFWSILDAQKVRQKQYEIAVCYKTSFMRCDQRSTGPRQVIMFCRLASRRLKAPLQKSAFVIQRPDCWAAIPILWARWFATLSLGPQILTFRPAALKFWVHLCPTSENRHLNLSC